MHKAVFTNPEKLRKFLPFLLSRALLQRSGNLPLSFSVISLNAALPATPRHAHVLFARHFLRSVLPWPLKKLTATVVVSKCTKKTCGQRYIIKVCANLHYLIASDSKYNTLFAEKGLFGWIVPHFFGQYLVKKMQDAHGLQSFYKSNFWAKHCVTTKGVKTKSNVCGWFTLSNGLSRA